MYSNVVSNLPHNDNELLMLPMRTQFSGSIECLFCLMMISVFCQQNLPVVMTSWFTVYIHRKLELLVEVVPVLVALGHSAAVL